MTKASALLSTSRLAHGLPDAIRRATAYAACAAAIYAAWLAWGYYNQAPASVRRHHLESAWFLIAALGVVNALTSPRTAIAAEPRAQGWQLVLAAGAALTATAWLYWPALDLGFLSDDYVLVTRAVSHHWWGGASTDFVRPVPLALWAGIGRLFGGGPFWFHVLNLSLHAVNTVLVFRLAHLMALPQTASSAAAALFLVNPVSVEAVAWASGVQDLLMTAMCLSFVIGAVARRGPLQTATALGALVIGLLSKETAVAAPVLACVALIASGRLRSVRDLGVVGAGVGVCVAYAAWRLAQPALPASFTATPTGYILKELVSRPFASLAVPWRAGTLDAHPWLGFAGSWLLSWLIVLATARWRAPILSTTPLVSWAAWVVVACMPVYTFLYISPDLEGARYLYLASAGWAVLLVLLVRSAVAGRHRAVVVGGGAVLAVLIATGSLGIRANLRPWLAANQLRTAVLNAAVRAAARHSCAAYAFDGLPDAVAGAYVFRNGFPDALRLQVSQIRILPSSSAKPECRFRWNGQEFVQPPLSSPQP